MKGSIHGDLILARKVEIYKITYSYLTQRKNKRISSCNVKILENKDSKREVIRKFYQAFLEYNLQEKYKKAFNAKILNVELVEKVEIEY